MIYHIASNAAEARAIVDAYAEHGVAARKVRIADCWLVLRA